MPLPMLDAALGSPSRVRLLRVLALASAAMSGRAAGRAAGVAHRAAVRALAQLVDSGVVRVEPGATAHAYSMAPAHPLTKRLRRLFEREAEQPVRGRASRTRRR